MPRLPVLRFGRSGTPDAVFEFEFYVIVQPCQPSLIAGCLIKEHKTQVTFESKK